MKFAKLIFLLFVYFLLVLNFITAQESTAGSPASNKNSSQFDDLDDYEEEDYDDYEEDVSSQDVDMDERIATVLLNTCAGYFEDCWFLMKSTKPYYSPEQRLKICITKTIGYEICESFTKAQAEKMKEEADKKLAAAKEAKQRSNENAAERKKKLAKRKKAVAAKWLSIEEQRREKLRSTTIKSVLETTTGRTI